MSNFVFMETFSMKCVWMMNPTLKYYYHVEIKNLSPTQACVNS